MDVTIIFIGVLVFLGLYFLFAGIQIVPDGHVRIVERMGRRHRVLTPGLNTIIPGLDRIKKKNIGLSVFLDNGERQVKLYDTKGNISIAEHRTDPPELPFLCKDNSEVIVNSVCYLKIVDAMKAVYDVNNFADTIISLIQTILRQEVGKYDGDSIIRSRENLSESLRAALQEASTAWGIRIMRVEIEDIHFDKEISEKLSQARREELIRRAEVVAAQAEADKKVLEAEAEKKSKILKAEGEKEFILKVAEGEKQAKILRAQADFEEQKLKAEADFLRASREQEGMAKGYAAIASALTSNGDAIIALESLKAQQGIAESLGKSQNSLIIPSDVAGLFGAFASVAKGVGKMTKEFRSEVKDEE
jgi:regulator of protease activity HflC (stomatin/prohibitin superfamily)